MEVDELVPVDEEAAKLLASIMDEAIAGPAALDFPSQPESPNSLPSGAAEAGRGDSGADAAATADAPGSEHEAAQQHAGGLRRQVFLSARVLAFRILCCRRRRRYRRHSGAETIPHSNTR